MSGFILRYPPESNDPKDLYKYLVELWKSQQAGAFNWDNIESGTIPNILTNVIITRGVKQVSTDYTATNSDDVLQVTASLTITLYSAAGNVGREITIDNAHAGEITVLPAAGEAIEGETSQEVPTSSTMALYSDGTEWRFT